MTRWAVPLLVAALLVVAGCAGPGDRTPEPIEGTASAATVGEAALSSAGYELVGVGADQVNRTGTIDVSGDVELTVDYRVDATAQRAVYRRAGAEAPAVFALHSAPLVSPDSVDVTLDPLGDRSAATVVTRAQDVYADVGSLDHVENTTATLLGTETTLAKDATTATADGERVEVFVYVALVRHRGDVVRAVAVLPRADDDPETVRSLLTAAEHGESS